MVKPDRAALIVLPLVLSALLAASPALFSDQSADRTTSDGSSRLEIAFDYERQSGIASNQFALWIEDASGRHVRTLYATRFSATGGYKKRRACLPAWVAAARPESLPDQRIDAITGATPAGGRLRYVWDGRDENGKRLPPGTYRYVLEANLRWDNRIVCNGTIALGGTAQFLRPTCDVIGDVDRERGMISNLAATYHP